MSAATERVFSFAAPEWPAIRGCIRTFCAESQVQSDRSHDILLAIGEAVSNAIEHAYRGKPGTIDLRLFLRGGCIEAEIQDRGEWRGELLPDRGYGEKIMRALSDSFQQLRDDGTLVLMRFSLP